MEKKTFRLTYPWAPEGYTPDTVYELGMNENGFTMHITTPESDPLREKTEHQQTVCLDSCVEWFVNFDPEHNDRYFNFEVNANGIMSVCFRKDRYDKTPLTVEDIKSLGIRTVLNADNWEVFYTVPFSLIEKYIPGYTYREGMKIRTNFYKCGGEVPHYGIWNPTGTEKPDFHLPQYFGEVTV